MIPDIRLEVLESAVDGDLLFIRWRGRGTGRKGPFEMGGIDRIRLRDGRVAETSSSSTPANSPPAPAIPGRGRDGVQRHRNVRGRRSQQRDPRVHNHADPIDPRLFWVRRSQPASAGWRILSTMAFEIGPEIAAHRDDARARWMGAAGLSARDAVIVCLKAGTDWTPLVVGLPDRDHEHARDLRGVPLARAALHGVDLSDVRLEYADLSGADLSRAVLRRSVLIGAEARGAQLTGADLSGARLMAADLRNADLRDAALAAASFTGADLRGADLRGANLTDAVFIGADLTGAMLDGARTEGALFGDSRRDTD
jgi:Pentapeptide repeats (8 copies)